MIIYFKTLTPDGVSFNYPAIPWAIRPGDVTKRPYRVTGSGWGDLIVSNTATGCVGTEWPARLLVVTPTPGGAVMPLNDLEAEAEAWVTVEERPGHELLGPQGAYIADLIGQLDRLTAPQARSIAATFRRLQPAVIGWTRDDERTLANVHRPGDARYPAFNAARRAAVAAVGRAADRARGQKGWGGTTEAVELAVLGLIMRDRVGENTYRLLTNPLAAALGRFHPGDHHPLPTLVKA